MIWLLVLVIVVMVVVLLFISSRPSGMDRESSYEVLADLYAIRRRLDVTQFKHELRRDVMRMKRELGKELDG